MFDLSLDGALARLRLVRPEARNAIPASGWVAFAERCEEAVRSGARLILVEGGREAFCAGADLSDFHAFTSDSQAVTRFRRSMREGIERVAALPVATIAHIEGPCFGAGVALAMACDLRVAGEGARFAITPAKFGISYPQEDIARLVALVGPGQASRLLLGAGTIDAAGAARIGLVDLGPENSGTELERLVHAILANSAESIRTLKRGIALAVAGSASDDEQDRLFDASFASEDFRTRLAGLRGGR
jgi:enoyl-CoA hydratase/carnithine racemase